MRRHPMVGDTMIALVLALCTLAESTTGFPTAHPLYYWSVGVLMVVPVVFRRQRPLLSAYLIMAGGVLQVLTHGDISDHPALPVRVADLALGVALYTLVVYTDRRSALVYAGALLVGTAIDLYWRVDERNSVLLLGFGASAIFGFSWVCGEFVGARRAYHAAVESRLRLLETERGQQATIAVAAERTRIARELHDVVAHAVSVIVVQADGAGYAIRTDPDLAESAVRTISGTGREALIELRRLLDVLRSDTDERDNRAPQPGVTALPDLADRVSAIGVPVLLTLRGELEGLSAAVGLGIYRIVQESLTNTLKHAGHGANATVRVERVGSQVEVEVADNDGTGVHDGQSTDRRHHRVIDAARDLASVSGGNGLIGMRERATVLGGTLVAGPAAQGGWRVRAVLPVAASDDGRTS
jgi:signal transduction histidine kinase